MTPLEMRGRVTDPDGRSQMRLWKSGRLRPINCNDVQDEDQPDGHLRGSFRTDGAGIFRFRTIMPVSYPIPRRSRRPVTRGDGASSFPAGTYSLHDQCTDIAR